MHLTFICYFKLNNCQRELEPNCVPMCTALNHWGLLITFNKSWKYLFIPKKLMKTFFYKHFSIHIPSFIMIEWSNQARKCIGTIGTVLRVKENILACKHFWTHGFFFFIIVIDVGTIVNKYLYTYICIDCLYYNMHMMNMVINNLYSFDFLINNFLNVNTHEHH